MDETMMEAKAPEPAQLPTHHSVGKLLVGFDCACGENGLIADMRAIQAVIFGQPVGVNCNKCSRPIQIGLHDTLVVPVQPQRSPQPINRHERRIIEALGR